MQKASENSLAQQRSYLGQRKKKDPPKKARGALATHASIKHAPAPPQASYQLILARTTPSPLPFAHWRCTHEICSQSASQFVERPSACCVKFWVPPPPLVFPCLSSSAPPPTTPPRLRTSLDDVPDSTRNLAHHGRCHGEVHASLAPPRALSGRAPDQPCPARRQHPAPGNAPSTCRTRTYPHVADFE